MSVRSDPAGHAIDIDSTATPLTVVATDLTAEEALGLVEAAKREAEAIVGEARKEAFAIYTTANVDAKRLIADAREEAALIRATGVPSDDRAVELQPDPEPEPHAVPAQPISPYDIVDDPDSDRESVFDEPQAVSRYQKHAGDMPRLGDEAGRDAIATATSLRDMLRR